MTDKATNVTWHKGEVTRAERLGLLKQKQGATLWFTGLSGSGKSTIAVSVESWLYKNGYLSYRLDGDNIRLGINNNLGFSAEDRCENIRRIAEIAKLFVDTGAIALSSFISPYRADRDLAKKLHQDAGMLFLEVYVYCPLDVAEERDPKGLYKKARSGEIPSFTGISDPYEEPETPDLLLESHKLSLEEETGIVVDCMRQNGVL
jgi:adenylylsulfate kinase